MKRYFSFEEADKSKKPKYPCLTITQSDAATSTSTSTSAADSIYPLPSIPCSAPTVTVQVAGITTAPQAEPHLSTSVSAESTVDNSTLINIETYNSSLTIPGVLGSSPEPATSTSAVATSTADPMPPAFASSLVTTSVQVAQTAGLH